MLSKKVLRSLYRRFDSKVFAIEEFKHLNSLKLTKLHGILTAFEMRFESEDSIRKEVAFKVSRKQIDQYSNIGSNLKEKKLSRSYKDVLVSIKEN